VSNKLTVGGSGEACVVGDTESLDVEAHSRQSAKLFLQSSELGLPHPPPAGECAPPPAFGSGGGGAHSLAGEGLGESQFRRGDIHCGTLCV
jgi:hypothetical protein